MHVTLTCRGCLIEDLRSLQVQGELQLAMMQEYLTVSYLVSAARACLFCAFNNKALLCCSYGFCSSCVLQLETECDVGNSCCCCCLYAAALVDD